MLWFGDGRDSGVAYTGRAGRANAKLRPKRSPPDGAALETRIAVVLVVLQIAWAQMGVTHIVSRAACSVDTCIGEGRWREGRDGLAELRKRR